MTKTKHQGSNCLLHSHLQCESSPWTAAPSGTIRLLWHGALQWLQGGYLLWCVQIGMPAPSLPSLTVAFCRIFSHVLFSPQSLLCKLCISQLLASTYCHS